MSFTPPSGNEGVEFGNADAPLEDATSKPSLILASYNIRYAVGSHLIMSGLLRKLGYNFPRHRSKAVARNISNAARAFSGGQLLPRPHILALQEADKETVRAGRQHVAARLAQQMASAFIHLSAGLPRGTKQEQREWWLNFEEHIGLNDSGETGVALLHRVALENVQRLNLPWHDCPWRPRVALAATFHFANNKVRLINVHISPHSGVANQHEQTEAVLDYAKDFEGPAVIAGDFNTLSKEKEIDIRRLMESRGYLTPFPTGIPTWRGAGLRFHADWIFVRGLRVVRWGVAKPLGVSDHWPIWAEIQPSDIAHQTSDDSLGNDRRLMSDV
jgi:endonuclease/exonuclease/phosphatase family metal-dependent hydrolase